MQQISIGDAIARRKTLCAAVAKLIREFEQETGLAVTSVDLRRIDIRELDGPLNFPHLVVVDCEVHLP